MLGNVIVIVVILVIIAGATAKIVMDRKNGIKCTGCPHSKTCARYGGCSSDKTVNAKR